MKNSIAFVILIVVAFLLFYLNLPVINYGFIALPILLFVITVLGIIAVVQFVDNNILMPRIVGSKVKINAMFAIIGVLIGGTIAGISGMFLSLPVIAVLKIIFDRSEQFKQWGVLLGDERPAKSPLTVPRFRKKDIVSTKSGTQKEV